MIPCLQGHSIFNILSCLLFSLLYYRVKVQPAPGQKVWEVTWNKCAWFWDVGGPPHFRSLLSRGLNGKWKFTNILSTVVGLYRSFNACRCWGKGPSGLLWVGVGWSTTCCRSLWSVYGRYSWLQEVKSFENCQRTSAGWIYPWLTISIWVAKRTPES